MIPYSEYTLSAKTENTIRNEYVKIKLNSYITQNGSEAPVAMGASWKAETPASFIEQLKKAKYADYQIQEEA